MHDLRRTHKSIARRFSGVPSPISPAAANGTVRLRAARRRRKVRPLPIDLTDTFYLIALAAHAERMRRLISVGVPPTLSAAVNGADHQLAAECRSKVRPPP